jgi:hypothetical protein
MTTTTKPTSLSPFPVLLDPTVPRFRRGDLVVIADVQPLVCVVLEETNDGLLRLSPAACPELHFAASVIEVHHLSAWLLTHTSRGESSTTRGRDNPLRTPIVRDASP